jgi:hypothetical protein
MEREIFYSQLLEFPIPASTTSKIQFQDQPLLRGARIFSLETYTGDDISVSPLGNVVISAADLSKGYFTGYTSDPTQIFVPDSRTNNQAGLWLDSIPLINMHKIQSTAGDPFSRDGFNLVGNQTLFWEKSYIFFGTPVTFGATTSVLLRVNYQLFAGNPTN